VAAFKIDGVIHYVLWQSDDWAEDSVVADGGRIRRFDSEAACKAAGEASQPVEQEPAQVQDFDPALAWLAAPTDNVPLGPALNLWNFAGDVARGVGSAWRDRDEMQDAVYKKLFAGNVPWVVGQDEGQAPHWSSAELGTLRSTLMDAVALLRRSLRATS